MKPVLALLIGGLTVFFALAQNEPSTLEMRVTELEQRVLVLETALASAAPRVAAPPLEIRFGSLTRVGPFNFASLVLRELPGGARLIGEVLLDPNEVAPIDRRDPRSATFQVSVLSESDLLVGFADFTVHSISGTRQAFSVDMPGVNVGSAHTLRMVVLNATRW